MTRPKQSIKHISLNQLVQHEHNRELDFDGVSELADSIREHGVLQPLVVTEHLTEPDRWLILAGHRRAAAARLAGLTAVPCVIRHGLDEDLDEQLIVMLVENCQRKDLTAMERAELYGQLHKRGLTYRDIARRTGTVQGTVAYYLSLLELDADSRDRVRTGEVAVTQAIGAVREVRAASRKAGGQKANGRPVVVEPAHLSKRHVLARRVKEACTHTQRPKVGDVGCGQCWEQAIRADERTPGQALGAAS